MDIPTPEPSFTVVSEIKEEATAEDDEVLNTQLTEALREADIP